MNDLIGALERLGYVVTAEDDRLSLHFTGPDAPPVDVVQPLLARLRGKKAEAIAFLKARAKERYCNAIAVGIAVPHEPKNVDSPDQTIQHCSIAPIVAPYGEKKIPGADGGDEREKAISESAPRQRTLTSAKVQYPAESLVSARADHPPMAGVSPSPSCIFPAPYTPTMGAILQCSDVFPCATKGNGELADCNTDCNGTAILATRATSA